MQYRADIDGLRAVAVLGVVLFHLGLKQFTGGFVGVDVFFVISGYLITSIIYNDILAGKFTFANFYERRVRRILPAYFGLLIVTTIAVYLVYVPEDVLQYSRAMQSSLLFVSNFLFAQKVGYFDTSYNDSPLLHTWSLSVEEQFYLLWPVILLLFFRHGLKRRRTFLLLGAVAAFFCLSEYLVHASPQLAFYMIYSRAWELGVGAIIALPILPEMRSTKGIELASFAGFVAVLCGLVLIDSTWPFPGAAAFLPVIGTATLIHSGKGNRLGLVHRLLSLKPLVFVGLLSYSLYLYHWPIITFTEYYFNRALTGGEALIIGATSLLAAALSYRFVERPFRRKDPQGYARLFYPAWIRSKRKLLYMTPGVILLFILGTIGMKESKGFVFRFGEMGRASMETRNPLRDECHLMHEGQEISIRDECLINSGQRPAILWGDSFADHYAPALHGWAESNDLKLYQISRSACAPIVRPGLAGTDKSGDHCDEFNNTVFSLIKEKHIEVVVLAGVWPEYQNKEEYAALANMVAALRGQGVEVVIVGRGPIFEQSPTTCYFKHLTPLKKILGADTSDGEECQLPRSEVEAQVGEANQFFAEVAKTTTGIYFFNPLPYFCDDDNCSAIQKGKMLYRDEGHLNLSGADYISRFFTIRLNNGRS